MGSWISGPKYTIAKTADVLNDVKTYTDYVQAGWIVCISDGSVQLADYNDQKVIFQVIHQGRLEYVSTNNSPGFYTLDVK